MSIKQYIKNNSPNYEYSYERLNKLIGGKKLIIKVWLNQHLKIKSFIDEWLVDLVLYKDVKYPDSMFYMKKTGKCILEYNTKNDNLYVKYYGFWSVLQKEYSMEYSDIQLVVKTMVEEAFKLKVETTHFMNNRYMLLVEEAFKLKL